MGVGNRQQKQVLAVPVGHTQTVSKPPHWSIHWLYDLEYVLCPAQCGSREPG